MKKVLFLSILLFATALVYAQQLEKDVTKFLGIPVDGSKSEMIKKLKAKGFDFNYENGGTNYLTGEFNGRDVNIYVVTNNNKVYRIMVADANYVSETDIKIRFNTLCSQFDKNERYIRASLLDDYNIPEDEDISYEMAIRNKRYQASYYQVNHEADSTEIKSKVAEYITQKYESPEALENLSEDDKMLAFAKILQKTIDEMFRNYSVWFMITESYGKYGIVIFYDNEYNKANGEDL